MKKRVFITLNIIIPLFVGSVLYYFMSPETIFVKIIDQIINSDVRSAIPVHSGVLRFLRFYFLDMCWAYALTFSLYVIIGNNTAGFGWRSFLLVFIFSASMEFLQLTSLVKGTFDVFDILCETLAEGIAVFIIKYAHEEAMKNEKEV